LWKSSFFEQITESAQKSKSKPPWDFFPDAEAELIESTRFFEQRVPSSFLIQRNAGLKKKGGAKMPQGSFIIFRHFPRNLCR
jgi:hypothetical protein